MSEQKIYKYDLWSSKETVLNIPAQATFLNFDYQDSEYGLGFKIWFLVDTDAPTIDRTFHIKYTGVPVPSTYKHLKTVCKIDLYYHLFEDLNRE